MKRLIEMLVDRFGPDKPTVPKKPLWQTDAFQKAKLNAHKQKVAKQQTAKRPPLEKPQSKSESSYSANVGGKIIDGGPGKNVLAQDQFVRENTGKHDTLKIVDDNLLGQIEEDGIDPYNTGRFDRSKSWDSSRFRK